MLEPRTAVEVVPGDGRVVEGAVGERSGSVVAPVSSGTRRPDPELAERAKRRRFTAEYKLGVLRDAAGLKGHGEIGAMLRREGLYTSHLTAWRKQQDAGALEGLEPRKRGPKGPSAEQVENAGLRRRLERAEADLETARRVIEVQGNVSALLEDLLAPRSATRNDAPQPRR
jgi:transposase-like protein